MENSKDLPEIHTSGALSNRNMAGLTISPIRKKKIKKKRQITSSYIPYPHPLSPPHIPTDKIPPISPQFLPSCAVNSKPYELLMIHNDHMYTIGIFPDEKSANDHRKRLLEQNKQLIKNKRLFLNGRWDYHGDYIIKPIPGDDRGL